MLIFDVRAKCFGIFDIGIWCLVFGAWYLVLGIWYLEFGIWNLVLGICCLLLRPLVPSL